MSDFAHNSESQVGISQPGDFRRELRLYMISMSVILLDQIVKFAVKFNMELNSSISVIGDFFKIHFLENKGAAFGLTIADIGAKVGMDITAETAKLILTLFSLGAIVVIIYFLRKVSIYRSPLPIFVAIILGGAVGNIIDRVFYGVWFFGMNEYPGGLLHGRVVDMFFFDFGTMNIFGSSIEMFPVFNIADSAISVGIVAIILFQGWFLKIHNRKMGISNSKESSGAVEAVEENTTKPSPDSSGP